MYIALIPVPLGPVFWLQEIPETPVIDQLPTPVGVAPPVGPVTVALKVKVEPRDSVGKLVVTVTEGATVFKPMEKIELGPAIV